MMKSLVSAIAVLAASIYLCYGQGFNLNSVTGFLQNNPQAFNLLSQGLGGPSNAAAASQGQCVNSENMLANTLLCALAGKQCGVASNNPLTGLISQFAGSVTSQISGLVSSNPVICIIVKQSCCLSQSGNNAQLASGLASVLLGGAGGGTAGSLVSGLIGGIGGQSQQQPQQQQQQQGGSGFNLGNIGSMLPQFLQG